MAITQRGIPAPQPYTPSGPTFDWDAYRAANPYPLSGIESIGDYFYGQLGAYDDAGAFMEDAYRRLAAQTQQAIAMMQQRPRNEGIYLYGY